MAGFHLDDTIAAGRKSAADRRESDGSSYDAWVRMGAPERMNRMERAMLCHSADPEYRVWEQETDPEGSLTVQERLEPHETALIEVEQIL